MLYSGVLTILSQLVTEITVKVIIDIPILQMKNLKLGGKCNLPKGAQLVNVRPGIQTQGSLSLSLYINRYPKLPFKNMHCPLKLLKRERKREKNFLKNKKRKKRNKNVSCLYIACRWWQVWENNCSELFKPRARQGREHLVCRG